MLIHKCDKCGKTAEQKAGEYNKTPKDWRNITFRVCGGRVEYEICAECRESLKIPTDYGQGEDDIGKRLIELLSEIAQEAVQE